LFASQVSSTLLMQARSLGQAVGEKAMKIDQLMDEEK
jgi:hypothetical protein